MKVDELRIVGSTQTNVVMAAELIRIAQRAVKKRPPEPRKEGLGQLVYPFDPDLAWAAVAYMRTPTRELRDVYRSRAERHAPLHEQLAAVLLMLCRFDPRKDTLVDPMCGSGTIPIEAGEMARASARSTPALRALGLARDAHPLYADADPLVVGCDIDLDVLAAARDNARSARATSITWMRMDIARLEPQAIHDIAREKGRTIENGLLLCNPPYGERLDERDLYELYRIMAETARRFTGWRAGFLVGNPLLEQAFYDAGMRPRIKKPLANANLRAYFYLYEL